MINVIYSFLKNFKNSNKSSKFNLYFFSNKKKNFRNSLNNFSITNKNKTWLKSKILYFNNQNTPWFNIKNSIKFLLLVALVYYKWSIIYYYFNDVLPYEIFFGYDLIIEICSALIEVLINTLAFLAFMLCATPLINENQ